MLAKEIQEGQKIIIKVDKLEFSSEIRVIRDEYMLIDLIVINEKIVNFPPSVKVDMIYFGEEDKLYIWDNVSIVPVKFKDGNKYHKISMPIEEGKRYNRRRHFRMYIGEEMRVDVKKAGEKTSIRALIKDVSATGFCFIFDQEFEVGQRVVLHFEPPEGKRFEFPGKIVRIQYNDNIRSNMYGCIITDTSGTMGKLINSMQQKILNERNN